MIKIKFFIFWAFAVIHVIGLTVLLAHYFRDLKAAKAAIRNVDTQVAETKFGTIENVKLGKGYPVLVVHGTFGGFDQGLLAAQPIIDAGYQVIPVSRFGYLGTPMPEDATVAMQPEVYACLLDQLSIDKVVVFTVSGGAPSSMRFAAKYPERTTALVLSSPAAPCEVQVPAPPRPMFGMMRSDFFYWILHQYFQPIMQKALGVPTSVKLSQADDARFKQLLLTTFPSSPRMDGFMFDNYGIDEEFFSLIDAINPYSVYNIQAPVLLLNALDDPISNLVNVRGLSEKIPNAGLIQVPDGGHPTMGHEQEIDRKIIEFLNEVADGPFSKG